MFLVIPAKAGIPLIGGLKASGTPAFAGVTREASLKDAIEEVREAIRRFNVPDTMEEFDRSRVGLAREELERLERQDEAEESTVEEQLCAKVAGFVPVVRCAVFKSRSLRLFAYVFVTTDEVRNRVRATLAEQVYEAVYSVFAQAGWFKDGLSKLKIVVESKETVDRDYQGSFWLRQKSEAPDEALVG